MEEQIDYEERASLLKALSNPIRLQIVHGLLISGCHNVGCMEASTGMSQSCISQHLQKLRAANVVTAERSGNEVYYQVASREVAPWWPTCWERRRTPMSYDVLVIGGGPRGCPRPSTSGHGGAAPWWSLIPWRKILSGGRKGWTTTWACPACPGPEMLAAMRRHAEQAGGGVSGGQGAERRADAGRLVCQRGAGYVQRQGCGAGGGRGPGKKFAGEAELLGRGVSYCATCDGMLYRGKPVAVVGYTDTARQEAEFLQKIGCSVTYFDRPKQCGSGATAGWSPSPATADHSGGGRVHPAAHHGPHGAVPGAGGGTGLCDGGPAYGHQSPRPVCRGETAPAVPFRSPRPREMG